MADSCEAAIAAGVAEIAFTDHVDFEPCDPSTGYWNADRYFRELEFVRERYGDRLTILSGAEVDFNTRTAPQVERFLRHHQFDFVIGSVHCHIENDVAQLIYPETFAGKSLDDIYLPYFANILAAVKTGWFDTIGHMDLPKRYAPVTHRNYDPYRYREQLQEIFAAMIANNVAFEINTSGLRRTGNASLPGPAVVRWYVEAGGRRITTGTDSHAAQTVGDGVALTLDMLELCGLDAILAFRGRVGHLVPIQQLKSANAEHDHVVAQ
jgi:histidinol-phosphatase (PHP family)